MQCWVSVLPQDAVSDFLYSVIFGGMDIGTHTHTHTLFFETWFLYLTALAVLELFVEQAGLELIEIYLPLPPKFWY